MPLDQLISIISTPRLSFYESFLNYKKPESKVGAYLAFQSISSSFFPVVQMVEVGLRNSINNISKKHFGDDEWFLTRPISQKSKDLVAMAVQKANTECGPRYSSDDVVCRLTLGFWVYMLDKEYRNTASGSFLWSPDNRKEVFSNAKNPWGADLTVAGLFDEYHKVLLLRNRLFHHEPIWKRHNCNNVNKAVDNIKRDFVFLLKTLNYLSPVKADILKCIDIPNSFDAMCTVEHVKNIIVKVEKELKP